MNAQRTTYDELDRVGICRGDAYDALEVSVELALIHRGE